MSKLYVNESECDGRSLYVNCIFKYPIIVFVNICMYICTKNNYNYKICNWFWCFVLCFVFTMRKCVFSILITDVRLVLDVVLLTRPIVISVRRVVLKSAFKWEWTRMVSTIDVYFILNTKFIKRHIKLKLEHLRRVNEV